MTIEQEQMLQMLRVFSEICENHHLCYYLAGGSLLGAVRHRGFIPWDDDIDVSMPLGDFLRFQTLAAELPENVVIQSGSSDPRYPFVFMKLCNTAYPFPTENHTGPWGVYIDIFPLIPAKRLCLSTRFCFSTIHVIDYVLQVKVGWTAFIPYKSSVARLGFRMLNCQNVGSLKRLRERLIGYIYDPDSKETLCSPGGAYKADKEFFPAAWYAATVAAAFEGENFRAPIGWQAYLSRNYGNYMELPPEEERCSRHK